MVNTFTFLYIYCQNIHILLHLWSIHSHFFTFTVTTSTFHYIYYIYGQNTHISLHLRSIHSHFFTFMVNTFTFMVKNSHFITVTVNTFTFYYIFCTFEGATLTMVNHVRPARLRLLLSSQASPYFRRKSLQTALSSNFPCERVSKKWKKCYYRTGKFFPLEPEKMFL